MTWVKTHRFSRAGCALADRHYNRRKVGSPQFVPPGRCLVLLDESGGALWVTSWPFAEFVRHAWAGAWVNSLFRNEGGGVASELIRAAVAATRAEWPEVPPLGMITFVDPRRVRATVRRGSKIHGYCYLKAGFRHVGFTKGGLWAWQMSPADMPEATPALGTQTELAVANV